MARGATRSLAATALLACVACGGGEEDPLVARGRAVYLANCTACHAADPRQDGGIGPAVAGASRELLEWRVVRGAYPPDYTPKRGSGVMPALPHLEPDLDALAAYLAATAR